jgi:hypothetical protein
LECDEINCRDSRGILLSALTHFDHFRWSIPPTNKNITVLCVLYPPTERMLTTFFFMVDTVNARTSASNPLVLSCLLLVLFTVSLPSPRAAKVGEEERTPRWRGRTFDRLRSPPTTLAPATIVRSHHKGTPTKNKKKSWLLLAYHSQQRGCEVSCCGLSGSVRPKNKKCCCTSLRRQTQILLRAIFFGM